MKANGTNPITYQWYKEGFPITWATNSTLTLTNVQPENAAGYSVVISNSWGWALSATATLIVNPAGVTLGLYPGLTIEGTVGNTYGIQSSTNVTQGSVWTTITNLMLSRPTQLWIDAESNVTAGNPQKFYRVIAVP